MTKASSLLVAAFALVFLPFHAVAEQPQATDNAPSVERYQPSSNAPDLVSGLRQENEGVVSIPYTGQTNLRCDNEIVQIPSSFPLVGEGKDNLYLIGNMNCSRNNFKVIVGVGRDCKGQNICLQASFSTSLAINSYATSEVIDALLDSHAQEIRLSRNLKGFFIPSQCFAYCTEAKIIWSDKGRFFVLGTKAGGNSQDTIEKLIQSANSYIEGKR